MNDLRQAAQQALEAVGAYIGSELTVGQRYTNEGHGLLDAHAALRAALAEPEQQPVAWMDIDDNGQRLTVRQWSDGNKDEVPLYTAPTPRKPLTDEEIADLWEGQLFHITDLKLAIDFVRDIERTHGIGEQT